jgi:hypothetical protein
VYLGFALAELGPQPVGQLLLLSVLEEEVVVVELTELVLELDLLVSPGVGGRS